MTILVVDDEPEYRLIMRTVLTSEGHDVLLAENGEEGILKLESVPVDLVISDIYMPVMDGIKFHRAVREIPEYETLPFLFVSAFDDQHTLDAVRDPRYEGFLRKARPVEELLEWIEYLTAPEDKKPKTPPGVRKVKAAPTTRGQRGGSNTMIY
jgi:CheY-like chemotaxis protein